MTPPAPKSSQAGRPRRLADVAAIILWIFIFLIGVIGSVLSSGAVHSGFRIFAGLAGLAAFIGTWNILTRIILEKVSGRSSSRRRSRGSSGGRDQDVLLPVITPLTSIGWRMMRSAAWLMPRAAGTRWLAEASGVLQETPPAQRRRVVRSYLCTAPEVIVRIWADYLARRIRPS